MSVSYRLFLYNCIVALYCSSDDIGNALINGKNETILLSANETKVFSCASDERLPGGRRINHATCVANVPHHLAKLSISPLTCQGQFSLRQTITL